MMMKFQWVPPTIPAAEHAQVEQLVVAALSDIEFLKNERRGVLVRFIPDSPPSAVLIATIEEERTGKLLGALESYRSESKVKVIPVDFA